MLADLTKMGVFKGECCYHAVVELVNYCCYSFCCCCYKYCKYHYEYRFLIVV